MLQGITVDVLYTPQLSQLVKGEDARKTSAVAMKTVDISTRVACKVEATSHAVAAGQLLGGLLLVAVEQLLLPTQRLLHAFHVSRPHVVICHFWGAPHLVSCLLPLRGACLGETLLKQVHNSSEGEAQDPADLGHKCGDQEGSRVRN